MKAKKGFELRKVAGENVIVAIGAENINFSHIITLNDSAAYLWTEVKGDEFTAEKLAELLVVKYKVEELIALTDSKVLIEAWFKAGIIY